MINHIKRFLNARLNDVRVIRKYGFIQWFIMFIVVGSPPLPQHPVPVLLDKYLD